MLQLAHSGPAGEVFNLCGKRTVALSDVMAVTGRDVPVKPNSPRVRYSVSIEKISRLADIPETRSTVLRFCAGFSNQASK